MGWCLLKKVQSHCPRPRDWDGCTSAKGDLRSLALAWAMNNPCLSAASNTPTELRNNVVPMYLVLALFLCVPLWLDDSGTRYGFSVCLSHRMTPSPI